MTLRVTFELSNADLKHFQLIMREARKAAASMNRQDIIDAANELLSEVRSAKVPGFIVDRLEKLENMIQMLTDVEWKLPEDETSRVLNALAYFGEPEDLIPDHIPGLGFLADAIMVELVVRELKHEIEAYKDFCEYRSREEKRRKTAGADDPTRDEWLKTRRMELQSRMRRRRRGDRRRRGGRRSRGRSPFSML